MRALADFPPLKVCELCSRLFTEFMTDGSRSRKVNIQFHMWYKAEGYGYRRTRRQLERAAIFGCVFCKGIASRDHNYKAGESVDTKEVCFEEPRPASWPPLDEELELAMRYNWVDNVLYIRSYRGVDWIGGDLSFSIYTTPDDPSATKVHAQVVLTELGSPESFADARGWMNGCLNNHENCPPNMPADLPTRLVQVSPLGMPESAHLRETHEEKGYYCALSYCWGGDQIHKTLSERYNGYKTDIPYSDLPKTIVDAFQVTRSMGLQYIWIDSLCIIQDSKEDKEIEMSKMMQIYQNTQFTISVASASNVTQGFLHTKLEESKVGAFYHPLRVDEKTMGSVLISESSSSFASLGVHEQPINTRGWTLQEALLTPRLLLVTDIHMVWKCQTGFLPDFHATSRDSHERLKGESPWDDWSSRCGYSFMSLKELQETDVPTTPKTGKSFYSSGSLYSRWHLILGTYVTRSLSFESDRLPAISAIAHAFASRFQSEYYAGLWGKYLIHELMWENWLSNPNVTKSGAPSWSWATINGEHHYDRGNAVKARAEVISCNTTLVSEENLFGAVTGGELVIRGDVKKVWLDMESRKLLDDQGIMIPDAEFISDGKFGEWPITPDCQNRIAILCLVLGDRGWRNLHGQCSMNGYCQEGSGRKCKRNTSIIAFMMALIKSQEREGCYERIGLAKGASYYPPYWWKECERTTVTVV